jgi:hypothetical protein
MDKARSRAGKPQYPFVRTYSPTGIHVVELELKPNGAFTHISTERFNLYKDTDAESKRWVKWVDKLPVGRVVVICITDTAMARTRPLGEAVYEALRKLGAGSSLTFIGYRRAVLL